MGRSFGGLGVSWGGLRRVLGAVGAILAIFVGSWSSVARSGPPPKDHFGRRTMCFTVEVVHRRFQRFYFVKNAMHNLNSKTHGSATKIVENHGSLDPPSPPSQAPKGDQNLQKIDAQID